MLLIFLSTLESAASSSRMAWSPSMEGPLVVVPSILPLFAPAPLAWPIVPCPPLTTPPPPGAPEEFAVPALLVPGAFGSLEALPARAALAEAGGAIPARGLSLCRAGIRNDLLRIELTQRFTIFGERS